MKQPFQRFSKPAHGTKVQICVPHSRFLPLPGMTPLVIAFNKGAEAKRLGRGTDANPYRERLNPNDGQLEAEWDRGYGL